MKLRMWGVGTAIVLWGLCARAGEPVEPAEPAENGAPDEAGLVCAQPMFNFGEARRDQSITNTFLLRNTGSNTVTIINVRPTCGCTTAVPSTNSVAPGATAELKAALSLAGRSGYQRKAIYVETNDPRKPRLRLEMAGLVVTDIEVQPQGVHFGTLAREGEAKRDVLLTARSNLTFTVTGVNTGSSQFSAEVEPREPGKSYWIHIKTQGPRSPGTCSAIVQVVTDCPTTPTITIPVSVFVGGDLIVVPAQLMLVASATNETRTANLTVYSPAGKTFSVKSVESPSPSIKATVATQVGGRVRIEVQSQGPLTEAEGKSLRILTDLEGARDVPVPLRVMRPQLPPRTP